MRIEAGTLEGLRLFGVSPEEIAAAEAEAEAAAASESADYLVEPHTWPTVQIFLELQHQWDRAFTPTGHMVLISLPADRVAAHLDKTQPRRRHRRLMTELTLMAAAAIDADREIQNSKKD